VINYAYVLTNNGVGDAALFSIVVTDNKVVTVSCPSTTLADGASMTCTGSYTTTAADVTAGNITNTATANALVSSDQIPDQKTAQATINFVAPAPAAGSITIIKTASGGNQTFNFTSTVTGAADFTLTTAGGTATRSFTGLTPGIYTFTEVNLPLHWKLSTLTCTGDTGGAPTTVNVSSLSASVGLDAGEAITCTFANVFDITKHIQQTQAIIQGFLSRRIQLLADDAPDRNRFLRRIPGSLWGDPGPSNGSSISTSPLSFSGSDSEMSSQRSIATSLSQLEMAYVKTQKDQQTPAVFAKAPPSSSPLASTYGVDVWTEAHFNEYRGNIGTLDNRGHFNILYLGADYLLTQSILIGALFQYDWTSESSQLLNSSVAGQGWMAGPYMSARLTPNLFFDARAEWGKSNNAVNPFGLYQDDFATDRWLAQANLTGNWWVGSFRVTPSAGVTYTAEKQQSYTDTLGIVISAKTVSLGQFAFGPEFAYRIVGRDGTTYEPQVSVKGLWDFVKPDAATVSGILVSNDTVRAMAQAGILARLPSGYSIRVVGQYDGIGSSSLRSYGGRVWVNVPLH